MKAARVRPAEVDAFIMRPLCKANKVPMEEEGGQEEGQEGGWGGIEVPEVLVVSTSFMRSLFPSARVCRPGWMEAGWEVKGVEAGIANHGINLLMVSMLKTP